MPNGELPPELPPEAPPEYEVPELYSPEYFEKLKKTYWRGMEEPMEEQAATLRNVLAGKGALYGTPIYREMGKLQREAQRGWQDILGGQLMEAAKYQAELPFREAPITGLYGAMPTLAAQQLEFQEQQWAGQLGLSQEELAWKKTEWGQQLSFEEAKWADQMGIAYDELGFEKQQWADTYGLDLERINFEKESFKQTHGLDEARFQEAKSQFEAELAWKKEEFQKRLTSEEEIWADRIGIDRERLALEKQDMANRYNISMEELNWRKNEFMTQFGLDEAKFQESKAQFEATLQEQMRAAQQAESLAWEQFEMPYEAMTSYQQAQIDTLVETERRLLAEQQAANLQSIMTAMGGYASLADMLGAGWDWLTGEGGGGGGGTLIDILEGGYA